MRVVTMNVWRQSGDWAALRSVLAAGFRDLQPDLVAFQETIVTDEYDQVIDLLGPGYHVAHQTMGLLGDGNHGVSIASRWPLGEIREVDLRVPHRVLDYACGTLIVEVRAPAPLGPLLFVNHGPWYPWTAEYVRERQAVVAARAVEEFVGQRGSIHVVLAGDFNALPDAASMRFWTGRQSLDGMSVCYRDLWAQARPGEPGYSFSPRNPLTAHDEPTLDEGRRIDYILVRCGDHGPTLNATDCALVFDQQRDGIWASDHFGVMADVNEPTGHHRHT